MQNQFQSGQSNFPPNPLEQKKSNSDLYSQNGSSHQAPTELLVLLEQTRSSTLVTRSSSKKTSRFLQWFYDLPVRRKQVLALLTSELISAVGLVGMGSLLIIQGGRIQLLNQAKSEVAVTEIGYNIKINQMGFGFRGQSENTAIIDAALANVRGSTLSPEQVQRVKGILANEVKVRQIEYATLVGTDLEIIVNANRDRTGERFDPEGLVGTVLANPRQIRTSALVSGEELEQEAPPLPEGYDGSDALIRYTFTPVFDPATDAVIGVLVSGDIVNNKVPIVEQTLDALQNGYSAVYTYDETEGFKLATSMDLGMSTNLEDAQVGVTLPSPNLLESAIQSENGMAAYRVPLGDQTYSMAASVIRNFNNEPIGVLVRGTSERSLNQLIWNSLRLQIIVACIAITADILLATILGRSIVRPLQGLRMMTQRFAEGDRQTRAEVFADDEVGQLTVAVNQLADAVADTEATLQAQARYQEKMANQAQFVTELTSEIRQSLDPNEILRIAVDGVREVMETDRVVVYRFNGDLKSGIITAESVAPNWDKTIGVLVEDPLVPEALERFRSGKLSVMDDLEKANLSNCHCQILQRFQVKANIAAPIIVGDELIGLLCAHECSAPRTWTREDIALMQQLSAQIGYALAQANLLRLQQERAGVERQINHIVSDMRRSLDQTEVYRIAVEETRAVLKADRVAVYSFLESGEGFFVAESVEAGYTPVLGRQLLDPCFNEKYHEQYRQGRVKATPNIYEAGLKDCHLKLLEPFEVKANIVTPIVVDKTLIGLLIAHQCSGPRNWTEMDVNFLQQIALQLGYALDQVKLFAQKEEARLEAENLSAEQRRQKEMLQQQLLMLLGDVEGASRGDLTVRADVTAGDIGTVADFFNSIIESLRQIVIQVKESATQVNSSLGQNEDAIQQLAEVALQQMEETNATLDTVEQITKSIQVVADNARQAAAVAQLASKTAETGGTAIDLTVQNILQLRETVGETAKKVKRLGESSQQISKVVSLINQIALQTNLLAINAGIEAARAGEEGQGFAVVAEEVGELASRSANATQEIEKIVEAIQRETSEVVAAMEQSTSQVVEGTRLVEDAKQSLSQVLEVSRQIDQLVQSISETTVSQVSTSESVSRLMKEIAHVSERTSMSSRQVSNALRQTVEIAQELQASVGTFKV